jgi:hypothetical protein
MSLQFAVKSLACAGNPVLAVSLHALARDACGPSVLVMAALVLAMAMPAFADKGGVPNEKACHGQTVKAGNQKGVTPAEGAQGVGVNNAGELNKGVKSGDFFVESPGGEVHNC